MIDRHSQVRRVRTLVHSLVFSNFFGEVVIKLESGNVVYVELVENRRVHPEEVPRIVESLITAPRVDLNVHPTRTGTASLVRISRKGSLQEMIPLGDDS